MIVHRPHALYYNGELVGIVLNPDPYPGGMADICDQLSPDEGLADAVTITTVNQPAWDRLKAALRELDVRSTIELEPNEFDDEDYQEAD